MSAAAAEARPGWEQWERDPEVAAVRLLGLVIWPAALVRLAAEAETVATLT